MPGSYGYSILACFLACLAPTVTQTFGVLFSVPGFYVVTLISRGFRAVGENAGKTFTASEARCNGDCRLPGFPVVKTPGFTPRIVYCLFNVYIGFSLTLKQSSSLQGKNIIGQNVQRDKTSYGQNVLGDKTSRGTNFPWDKTYRGQNVQRDKTSSGTK